MRCRLEAHCLGWKLGKLVDRRGKEWEGRTSAYKELTQAELLKPPYNMVLGW